MTVIGVIATAVAILLAAAVVTILVVGGILFWYISDSEHRATREFSRIHRPLAPLEPRPLDTDPDGPTGRPFRPIYRGSTPSTPDPATNYEPRKDG